MVLNCLQEVLRKYDCTFSRVWSGRKVSFVHLTSLCCQQNVQYSAVFSVITHQLQKLPYAPQTIVFHEQITDITTVKGYRFKIQYFFFYWCMMNILKYKNRIMETLSLFLVVPEMAPQRIVLKRIVLLRHCPLKLSNQRHATSFASSQNSISFGE